MSKQSVLLLHRIECCDTLTRALRSLPLTNCTTVQLSVKVLTRVRFSPGCYHRVHLLLPTTLLPLRGRAETLLSVSILYLCVYGGVVTRSRLTVPRCDAMLDVGCWVNLFRLSSYWVGYAPPLGHILQHPPTSYGTNVIYHQHHEPIIYLVLYTRGFITSPNFITDIYLCNFIILFHSGNYFYLFF